MTSPGLLAADDRCALGCMQGMDLVQGRQLGVYGSARSDTMKRPLSLTDFATHPIDQLPPSPRLIKLDTAHYAYPPLAQPYPMPVQHPSHSQTQTLASLAAAASDVYAQQTTTTLGRDGWPARPALSATSTSFLMESRSANHQPQPLFSDYSDALPLPAPYSSLSPVHQHHYSPALSSPGMPSAMVTMGELLSQHSLRYRPLPPPLPVSPPSLRGVGQAVQNGFDHPSSVYPEKMREFAQAAGPASKMRFETDQVGAEERRNKIRQSIVETDNVKLDTTPTGLTTVVCFHASVAQKSYGKEKRLLCPPPMVRITGPMRRLAFKPSTMMTILSSDGAKQKFEKAPLSLSSSTITASNGLLSAGFKSLYVTSATPTKTISLRLSLHPPPPALPHQDARLISVSRDPILLPAFATCDSAAIDIISKPSRKTARARNLKSCLLNGSSVAFFSRINSQTVRTRYLGVGEKDGYLAARSGTWSAFTIIVVDPITLLPLVVEPAVSSATPSPVIGGMGGGTAVKMSGSSKDSTRGSPIMYGSTVILTDRVTGISTPSLVIRKVEKNEVVRDAVGPVSQLQKLALERTVPKRRVTQEGRRGGPIVAESETESVYLSTSAEGCDETGEPAAVGTKAKGGRSSGEEESVKSDTGRKRIKRDVDEADSEEEMVSRGGEVPGAVRSHITFLPPRRIISATMSSLAASRTTKGKGGKELKGRRQRKGKGKMVEDDDDEMEGNEDDVDADVDGDQDGIMGEMHEIDDVQSWTVIGIATFSHSFFDAFGTGVSTLPSESVTPFPVVSSPPVWNHTRGDLQLKVSNLFYSVPNTNQVAPLEVWLGPLGPLSTRIVYPEKGYPGQIGEDEAKDGLGTVIFVTLPPFETIAQTAAPTSTPRSPLSRSHSRLHSHPLVLSRSTNHSDQSAPPLGLSHDRHSMTGQPALATAGGTFGSFPMIDPASLIRRGSLDYGHPYTQPLYHSATPSLSSAPSLYPTHHLASSATATRSPRLPPPPPSALWNFAGPPQPSIRSTNGNGGRGVSPIVLNSITLPLLLVRPSDGVGYVMGPSIVAEQMRNDTEWASRMGETTWRIRIE